MHNLAPDRARAWCSAPRLAWWSGKRVAMTDMPQMVALYNGMGGGSAAAIGAVELLRFSARRGARAQSQADAWCSAWSAR